MKKLTMIMLLLIPALTLNAQVRQGDNFLGGSIGLGTQGNSPVLGASFESMISGSLTGVVGIGGLYRYHGYTENGSSRDYNFSSLGAQVNYNFTNIGAGEFVPYVGVTVGYNKVSSDVNGNNNVIDDESYSSGVWVWGQLGARYFFSSKVAATLRVGLGNNDFYPLELGIDFKL
ncbi:MAG: hypothetical protein WBC65_09535 [Ignavibacteria bacterium]